jgi:plastocyanin
MASPKIVVGSLMFIGIALIAAILGVLILPPQTVSEPLEPNVFITIYGDEIAGAKFGFGLSSDNVTSPGPTLNFTVGDVIQVTFHNIGNMPHTFALVQELSDNPQILFNSEIGSRVQPIPPGGGGSVVFRVDKAGQYYYICTVPGHYVLGMWGMVLVE